MGNKQHKPPLPTTVQGADVKSPEMRDYVIKNIIAPLYTNELNDTKKWRKLWRIIKNVLIVSYHLGMFSSIVISFIAGSFSQYSWLSIVSGCVSLVVSQGIERLSKFARGRESEATRDFNTYLKNLGIDEIPDISSDADEPTEVTEPTNPIIPLPAKVPKIPPTVEPTVAVPPKPAEPPAPPIAPVSQPVVTVVNTTTTTTPTPSPSEPTLAPK